MRNYLDLMKTVLDTGIDHTDRTGVGRRSIFDATLSWDLRDGLPLVTTRKINVGALVQELLWFISGSTDASEIPLWAKWRVTETDVDEFMVRYQLQIPADQVELVRTGLMQRVGHVGPMYGQAWRHAPNLQAHDLMPPIPVSEMPSDRLSIYEATYRHTTQSLASTPDAVVPTRDEVYNYMYRQSIDQLNDLVRGLRSRPYSSRHVVSAWIPAWIPDETLSPQINVLLDQGALAPCHTGFQCYVEPNPDDATSPLISMKFTMRSSDVAVGLPYNIASYAILLHLLAQVCGYTAHRLIYSGGDVHLYQNQLELAAAQCQRDPRPLPHIWLNPAIKDLFAFTIRDIMINDYDPDASMTYGVAV